MAPDRPSPPSPSHVGQIPAFLGRPSSAFPTQAPLATRDACPDGRKGIDPLQEVLEAILANLPLTFYLIHY